MSLDYISASAQIWSAAQSQSWLGSLCVTSPWLCWCLRAFLSPRMTFVLMWIRAFHGDRGAFSCGHACSSSRANAASCSRCSNWSRRRVTPPAAGVCSMFDTTKSSGGELKMHAYRPSAPPPASVSWKLWRWSSCFSLRMCSSPRPTLPLWLCTSCLSSGRQSDGRPVAKSPSVRWKPKNIWFLKTIR